MRSLLLCAVLALVGCEEKMKKKEIYKSTHMTGIVSTPAEKSDSILILLHGVGANEVDLVEVGEKISPTSMVVSLRAPIVLGGSSFAWFHVQFTSTGPVHNWEEAKQSFELLENEIRDISKKYDIPLSKISVMGFSQGSIMTMGLLLKSKLNLSRYLCFSGRTLPEFAQSALENPEIPLGRKVYLTHGFDDDKLPIALGRTSKEILEKVKANYRYHEFPGGHGIVNQVLDGASKWMKEIL
jgi:phospholipase/carboxylesterase